MRERVYLYVKEELKEYIDLLERLDRVLTSIENQVNELDKHQYSNKILSLRARQVYVMKEISRINKQLQDKKVKENEQRRFKMKKAILAILFLLTLSNLSYAQTNVITFPIPATTRIGWTHDGVNVTGFRLITDGLPVDLGNVPRIPVTATNPTLYSVPFPALTPGNHILVIQAYNASGNAIREPIGTRTDELQVVVSVGIPNAPTGFVLIQSNK